MQYLCLSVNPGGIYVNRILQKTSSWGGPTRAGLHLCLRTSCEQSNSKMSTTPSANQTPSLTLTLELIPSCCGHPTVLLTQPIGAEATSTQGDWDEKKDTIEQRHRSPLLPSRDAAWPDNWSESHIRQAIWRLYLSNPLRNKRYICLWTK